MQLGPTPSGQGNDGTSDAENSISMFAYVSERKEFQLDKDELHGAVEGFYDALDSVFAGDAGPMGQVWSHAADITCMGPAGDLLVGWPPIEATWVAQAGVVESGTVRPEGIHVFASGDLGVSVGFEHGHVVIGGRSSNVHARATNVFRREDGVWRMIGHHTDPHVATDHEAT